MVLIVHVYFRFSFYNNAELESVKTEEIWKL